MGQQSVVTVDDVTHLRFEERRPGCAKGVLHEHAAVQSAVFRVGPGSGVPVHLHSRVYDLFVGMRGHLEIRYEGQRGSGTFDLRPGGFCAVPPGVRHEVFNPHESEVAYFVIVHAPHEGYDYIPADFRRVQAALTDRAYKSPKRESADTPVGDD